MKLNLLFSSFPFLSCDTVTISRITATDMQSLWEIMSDDENYRYSPTGALHTIAEIRTKIAQIDSLFREKKGIILGIFSNDSLNKLIGLLEISNFKPQISCISVDIMMNREYSGKSLARSAIETLCKYLVEIIEVNRIEAYVMPNNLRCKHLLERSGFTKDGTIREGFLWPDKGLVDLDLYSLLASDYHRRHDPGGLRGSHRF